MCSVLAVQRDILWDLQKMFDHIQIEVIQHCPVMEDEFFSPFLRIAGKLFVLFDQRQVGCGHETDLKAGAFKSRDQPS